MRREWIEMVSEECAKKYEKSPSMRREWIEIISMLRSARRKIVSLHAEGVD